jgi:hypothetical protein
MKTSETLNLQAFTQALTHLDQSLGADIEAEIIQKISSLIQVADKSQLLQQSYNEALLDLIENYPTQTRFIKPLTAKTDKTPLEIFEENGLVGCYEGDQDPSASHQSIISDYLLQKQQQGRL